VNVNRGTKKSALRYLNFSAFNETHRDELSKQIGWAALDSGYDYALTYFDRA
jgi:hypothetical protein